MGKRPKVAVTGPEGRLGRALVSLGCAPLVCDITSIRSIQAAIRDTRPDVIVNAAAITDVDRCETLPFYVVANTNVDGVRNLRECFAGLIVQLSTDYVFDGVEGPYHEGQPPNPVQMYGISKRAAELAILKTSPSLVVRTTYLFDKESESTVSAIIMRLLAGEPVQLSPFRKTTPTYTPDLAEGILRAVDRGKTGILNIVGDRLLTRAGLGRWIAQGLGLPMEKIVDGPEDGEGMARRPINGGLLVDKARELGLPISDTRIRIEEVCQYAMARVAVS